MKYLIKDLANLTEFSPDRIRKWQERYHILLPEVGKNGYHYYSNEDLKILLFIKQELKKGRKLKEIIQKPRSEILNEYFHYNEFSQEEIEIIRKIASYNYKPIETYLKKIYKNAGFFQWSKEVHKLILLTGRAWEKNLISISDEHSFSSWIKGHILSQAIKMASNQKPIWLVCIYPKDEHELGALLHYVKLLKLKVPARYVGKLPKEELIKEIKHNQYRVVSISVVMPRKWNELQKLKEDILKHHTCKVLFGGYGYKKMKEKLKGEFV